MKLSLPSSTVCTILFFFSFFFSLPGGESCNPVSRSSLHTKYLPARTTHARFHTFPAILRTSLTFACLRSTGHCSRSGLFIASTLLRGSEILNVCELIVNPRASIVWCPILRSSSGLGWALCLPLPVRTSARDPRLTRLTRLGRSCHRLSACCTLTSKQSSTYHTVAKNGSSNSPATCALIFAPGGIGVGFPSSHRSTTFTWAII